MGNWKTYTNGNYQVIFNMEDGTKIRKTEDDEFIPAFAENMDIKISNYCDMGCPFCHEGSDISGSHANLDQEFINTLHPYQEVALGGGDVTSHPGLLPFLEKLKAMNVVANITVNQKHFMEKQDLIHRLADNGLVKGIGVSLTNPTEDFIKTVSRYPNAVIHVINGIFCPDDARTLANRDLKVLILGYKDLRRGHGHLVKEQQKIKANQDWLKENIGDMIKNGSFKVLSFDNLAITQLNVRSHMDEKQWENFYMGDDGTHTYYIDMVEKKFAASSTAPMDQRYPVLESVDAMFHKITEKPHVAGDH